MPITQSIVNSSQTALSVGGGNFLTQSGAVARHTFHRSLVLAEGESADAWREVTPQERTAIEAQDAAWTRPPQAFIDMWNTRAGEYGCYNEATGFFELNGITDIAYEEALRIDAVSTWPACVAFGRLQGVLARDLKVRTVFPFYLKASDTLQIDFFAASNASIEVLRFVSNGTIQFTNFNFAFYYCAKLKRIEGPINVNASDIVSAFSGCWSLQEVRLRSLRWDVNFAHCALLSLASIDYLITNRAGTNGITVTLHPTVYDKIMDEANEEWHALLDKAASKNITIATTN